MLLQQVLEIGSKTQSSKGDIETSVLRYKMLMSCVDFYTILQEMSGVQLLAFVRPALYGGADIYPAQMAFHSLVLINHFL